MVPNFRIFATFDHSEFCGNTAQKITAKLPRKKKQTCEYLVFYHREMVSIKKKKFTVRNNIQIIK